jgi:hypothetical protein
MEELVAELGAAFTCPGLDLEPPPRDEHASYIADWLTVLKNDKRAIFSAAAHAQRAADFLQALQPAPQAGGRVMSKRRRAFKRGGDYSAAGVSPEGSTFPASRGHGSPDVMSGWRGSDSTAPM